MTRASLDGVRNRQKLCGDSAIGPEPVLGLDSTRCDLRRCQPLKRESWLPAQALGDIRRDPYVAWKVAKQGSAPHFFIAELS